ncbi:uncharacterized protein BO95DRAFT_513387 [Aspergillus brunneoviolaceus CBS 621.78]|uniref:Uncharacterized protein n=1 Tax=Aspergillus brunneoviolaceus CBS 621.78 TaxID=1450534 RepID=A0ACD1GD08_9EURO|nr:hypothetical protein BO95DRAFT_513387 [Aspergillus brunneoviolaceus CBS 621.78]RAH47102.1 hypothetical protein BO95DRAFT_513387 [Aspergillus brunneoviolaceus CBS 621.78]
MTPTREDIAKFLTIVPQANEGQALLYLQGANTLEEAVTQFYDGSLTHANGAAPVDTSNSVSQDQSAQPDHADPLPSYQAAVAMGGNEARAVHTNLVIEAAKLRARDEQEMQNRLQQIQWDHQIFNDEIEPEHEAKHMLTCACDIHQYKTRKQNRVAVLKMWSEAVMYPGEKYYHDCYYSQQIWNNNPYARIITPYGPVGRVRQKPVARYHARWLVETIRLNSSLNATAQRIANQYEPTENIWEVEDEPVAANDGDGSDTAHHRSDSLKPSILTQMRRSLSLRSSEERESTRKAKRREEYRELRHTILAEEAGRWPDPESRRIVTEYQEHLGLTQRIAALRVHRPMQYLHLLRAGYFEPIPVAWAKQNSNPLKFRIEAAEGWRGITPTWRGYENTAEERLYWVLNHRDESTNGSEPRQWLKPDVISALEMARTRMATAVDLPPVYEALDDICQTQTPSAVGYSRQVMPSPLRAIDAPELPTDNTMILLDVSGSMDFDPVRPSYEQYMVTRYERTMQPKNKDVAKAVIRRFTDALATHDQNREGYQLVTFANKAAYMGYINHRNFASVWSQITVGGGTRVMAGWQQVKDLHFQRHAAFATYHAVYGWQAGPQMPILRLLLLLDGEATDMDEFELELLSLSWVHVTIFLIGADGCPHHHRHANELQRISEVNPHVAFVDAQGNTPERYVTHELLKRHLGYEVTLSEFEEWERHAPPAYETPV